MSHFSVAVITAKKPTHELLKYVLQPFHEYECTGIDDEYVQNLSQLGQIRDSYECASRTRMKCQETGELRHCHDKKFLRSPTEHERVLIEEQTTGKVPFWSSSHDVEIDGVKVQVVREEKNSDEWKIRDFTGWDQVEIKAKDLMSFLEYAKDYTCSPVVSPGYVEQERKKNGGKYCSSHKWGWIEYSQEKDEVIDIVRRTNPNATWDWWETGGRWRQMLLTKKGKTVDSCRLDELDFDTRIEELKAKAIDLYDYFESCLGDCEGEDRTWRTWDEIYKDKSLVTIDDKRTAYHEQKALKTIHENDTRKLFQPFLGMDIDDFRVSREEYIKQKSNEAFQCYNVLIASEAATEHLGWYGGQMGWFGLGDQEENWSQTYQDLLRSQPKDHYITIVDCHI
ncbi:hypothetical protein ACT438_18815 (plasmid) [Acinetobacter baumannii]